MVTTNIWLLSLFSNEFFFLMEMEFSTGWWWKGEREKEPSNYVVNGAPCHQHYWPDCPPCSAITGPDALSRVYMWYAKHTQQARRRGPSSGSWKINQLKWDDSRWNSLKGIIPIPGLMGMTGDAQGREVKHWIEIWSNSYFHIEHSVQWFVF